MCSSKQLHREFNSPTDCLANLDVSAFLWEMQYVIPGGVFVRLDVPAQMTDLSVLLAWTTNISAIGQKGDYRVGQADATPCEDHCRASANHGHRQGVRQGEGLRLDHPDGWWTGPLLPLLGAANKCFKCFQGFSDLRTLVLAAPRRRDDASERS
jgi:hypothetical protein